MRFEAGNSITWSDEAQEEAPTMVRDLEKRFGQPPYEVTIVCDVPEGRQQKNVKHSQWIMKMDGRSVTISGWYFQKIS